MTPFASSGLCMAYEFHSSVCSSYKGMFDGFCLMALFSSFHLLFREVPQETLKIYLLTFAFPSFIFTYVFICIFSPL